MITYTMVYKDENGSARAIKKKDTHINFYNKYIGTVEKLISIYKYGYLEVWDSKNKIYTIYINTNNMANKKALINIAFADFPYKENIRL